MKGEIICFSNGHGDVWKGLVLDTILLNGNSHYLVKVNDDVDSVKNVDPKYILTVGSVDSESYYRRHQEHKKNYPRR